MGASSSKKEKEVAKPEKAQITGSDRSKLQLKMQRDHLVAAIRRYERVRDTEHSKAVQFLKAGDKRKSLYCLKRERAQQEQINTVTSILDNVQKLIDSVEFAQIEAEVFTALKDGKGELDRLNKLLDIDDIEQLMEETAESIEMARQIDAVISQPLTTEETNDDLLAELLASIGEPKEKQSDLPKVVVPQHELPKVSEKEKDNEDPTRVLESA